MKEVFKENKEAKTINFLNIADLISEIENNLIHYTIYY